VGYTIADRRLLPGGPRALSLAVGAAAGLAALAIRARGYGIEASLVAVAAVQAGAAVIVVVSTLVRSGRLGIPGLRPAGAGPQSK
jgi:hypothetical protein